MTATTINILIALIAWYYCLSAINAQSFSVMFRGTKIPTPSNSSSSYGGRAAFVSYPLTSEKSDQSNINKSQSFLDKLRRYFEWAISYFTLAMDTLHEKSAESQSPRYGHSNSTRPNFRYYRQSYGSSTVIDLDTSLQPSCQPTQQSSGQPSALPSTEPTNQPSQEPTSGDCFPPALNQADLPYQPPTITSYYNH